MKRSVMIVLALALVFASAITAPLRNGRFGGLSKRVQANPPTLDPHRTTNTVTQQIVSTSSNH